jgi:methylenetetrahydrofolate dehydrogenase (NADP+)/methenyltetrahydrofolate cyclohydrolase
VRVEALKAKSDGRTPVLATILVGEDPASATYVKMKGNACRRVGMESMAIELPASTRTNDLLREIEQLNQNPDVHGILLQHPVPSQIDERACFDMIALEKDVDGVTCLGFGRMAMGEPAYGCATPQGIMRLLSALRIEPGGPSCSGGRPKSYFRQTHGDDAVGGKCHRDYLPFPYQTA